MRKQTLHIALAILLLLSWEGRVFAGTATTTFQVTATVTAACSVTATNLSFGSYDPSSATNNDATSTVTPTCTLLTAYNIGLNAGTGSGATVTTRKMTKGSDTLNYSLYRDAVRSQNWGDTVGTDTVSGTGTGLGVATIVYGRIPASQNVPTGSYADTITVTVTF